MHKPECEDRVKDLVGEHAVSLLTPADLDHAVDQAAIPDREGRIPGVDGWVPSYEPFWAAAEAVTVLAIRAATTPTLTEVTAEGARFVRRAPEWWAAAAALRARSPIAQAIAAAAGGLGVLELEGGVGYDTTAQTWPDNQARGIIGNWT